MQHIRIRLKDLKQRQCVRVCKDGRRRNALRPLTPAEWLIRFFDQIDEHAPKGCWAWTGATYRGGYGHFRRDGRNVKVHRFSYEYFIGKIPKGLIVRHTCDNPACVNPMHLLTGTQRDNVNDKIKRGRMRWGTLRGEESPRAKITTAAVLKLKALRDSGKHTIRAMAKRTGITPTNAAAIVQGRTWRHVTGYPPPLVKV